MAVKVKRYFKLDPVVWPTLPPAPVCPACLRIRRKRARCF